VVKILCEPVKEGNIQETKDRLYRGSGSLSAEVKNRDMDKLIEVFDMARRAKVKLLCVTTGRGIVHIGDDDEFKSRLQEKGFGRGFGKVSFMPSTDYVMSEAASSAMSMSGLVR